MKRIPDNCKYIKRSAKSENARQGEYDGMEKRHDPKAYERFKAKPYQMKNREEKAFQIRNLSVIW